MSVDGCTVDFLHVGVQYGSAMVEYCWQLLTARKLNRKAGGSCQPNWLLTIQYLVDTAQLIVTDGPSTPIMQGSKQHT